MKLIATRNLIHGRHRVEKGKPFEAEDAHAERLIKNGLATKPGGKAKDKDPEKPEKPEKPETAPPAAGN